MMTIMAMMLLMKQKMMLILMLILGMVVMDGEIWLIYFKARKPLLK